MSSSIFRKKSIDRISSPEQFDEYVKVASPGVWMMMGAILIFLAGAIVWGVFGRLETFETVAVVSDGTTTTVYIDDSVAGNITSGMELRTDYGTGRIVRVDLEPEYIDSDKSPDIVHAMGRSDDVWVYSARTMSALPEGTYSGTLVIDSVSPISFVTN